MSAVRENTMLKAALFRAITRAERRRAGVFPFEPRDRQLEQLEDRLLGMVSNLPGRHRAADEAPAQVAGVQCITTSPGAAPTAPGSTYHGGNP